MTSDRKLPIGIQDFEKLRSRGYVYVDKTQYVYKLVQTDNPYFLGRPRRFGKSLFASTLKAYFEGKRHLFDGLAIADLEKDWIEYPVVYIDLSQVSYFGVQNLHNILNHILSGYEEQWGITSKESEYSLRLANVIKTMYRQTGKQVVVLVDEYDKPLIGTMDNFDAHEDIRITLRGFYGVLKGLDACLRFVFLTGITKFSKISLFSDLNQLNDLSMDKAYAGICGITYQELESYFAPELHGMASETGMTYEELLAEMKRRYDGYHFAPDSEGIYNPFSVMNALASRYFGSYWFETGTPSMLVRRVKVENLNPLDFDRDISITSKEIKDYRPNETSIIPLLYQAGYLTIKSCNTKSGEYVLGYPNLEVRYGFLEELLPQYTPDYGKGSFTVSAFVRNLRTGETEEFMEQLESYFASIPYDAVPKQLKREKFYQFVFYQLFVLMGQLVESEVKSSRGRADAVVKTDSTIYVFEFKMDDNATAEDALAQIDDKGYPIPYAADHRPVVKIGVEFSIAEGGIKRWLIANNND